MQQAIETLKNGNKNLKEEKFHPILEFLQVWDNSGPPKRNYNVNNTAQIWINTIFCFQKCDFSFVIFL